MKAPRLTARDRRVLRLGLWIVVPSLVFGLVLKPFWAIRSDVVARLAAERALLGRETALLSQVGLFTSELNGAGQSLLNAAPKLFSGDDPVAASSVLANYVGEQAARHRVFVQRAETQTPGPAGTGVGALQVEVRAVGDLNGIMSFLYALEHGEKLVQMEVITLTRADRIGGTPGADEEAISLVAIIRGFVLEPLTERGEGETALREAR